MSSVCPCCGQIVGSIPSQMDDLRKQTEFEQAAIDAILYGEGYLIDGLRIDPKVIKIDTSMSENDGDSEEHF